jgi:hypothetical protein
MKKEIVNELKQELKTVYKDEIYNMVEDKLNKIEGSGKKKGKKDKGAKTLEL